jgi:uncharacterized protein (DUF362 family)
MKDAHGSFSRRNVLAVSGMTAGALAATHAGTAALSRSAPTAPVSVAKVASYDEDLVAQFEKMFDQIGGIGSLVKGKTVAMKLNLMGGGGFEGYSPGQTSQVHPNLAGALIAVLGKLGAKRIRLLESSSRKEGTPLEDKLLKSGWDVNVIKNAAPGVEFEDTNGLGQGKKYSTLKVRTRPYIFPAFALNHSYEDCDFFVSVGKMKNHEEMGISLSMKNLFGITPDLLYGADPVRPGVARTVRERVFHYGQVPPPAGLPQELDPKSNRYEGWRLPRLLTDICGARPIDLAVIDGIESLIGGEGMLPGAKPAKPRLLVLGRNCVCTDAVAVATMGYNPRAGRREAPFRVYKSPRTHPPEQMIPPGESFQYADNIMLLGEAVGMGTADLSKIDVRGVPIKDAVYDYESRWKGQERI